MELIYGTGNQAKLETMKRALAPLKLTLLGLEDLSLPIPQVVESGSSPLENARIKALAYYRTYGRPVFSCDSGLYFQGLPESLQPGVHVRHVQGRHLSDDEMISHYGGLANKYGDLPARYQNAICFVYDKNHLFESMAEDLSGTAFLLTATPHPRRKAGFPLDSLSIEPKTGKYYYDLKDTQVDDIAWAQGVVRFFIEAFHELNLPAS